MVLDVAADSGLQFPYRRVAPGLSRHRPGGASSLPFPAGRLSAYR